MTPGKWFRSLSAVTSLATSPAARPHQSVAAEDHVVLGRHRLHIPRLDLVMRAEQAVSARAICGPGVGFPAVLGMMHSNGAVATLP